LTNTDTRLMSALLRPRHKQEERLLCITLERVFATATGAEALPQARCWRRRASFFVTHAYPFPPCRPSPSPALA
jgi:hypothetical protein